jgi:hypothetical protein
MSPELKDADIETLLLHQPRREPCRALDDRVAAFFNSAAPQQAPAPFGAPPPPSPLRFKNFVYAAAALAACVVMTFSLMSIRNTLDTAITPIHVADAAHSVTSVAMANPIRVDEVYSQDEAGDVVLTSDNQPVVPVRRQVMHTTRWLDPATNVRMEVTRPVEQIVVLPAEID